MLRLLRRQREILHARIDIGKITVRSDTRTEAVIRMGVHEDPVRRLGAAGYTLVRCGFPRIVPGRPFTILVRRRLRQPGAFSGQ